MGWNCILVTLAETFRDVWELNRFRFRVEELSGSGIHRRSNSLCLRLNRKLDRMTRNIRGSLKYETTVLFKTICRTEENTVAHLNIGSCFKVVWGGYSLCSDSTTWFVFVHLCVLVWERWAEGIQSDVRASRATAELMSQVTYETVLLTVVMSFAQVQFCEGTARIQQRPISACNVL